ncbi:MAG: hypothetical protein AAF221_10115 [Pseudomonadota bacterium]
MADQKPNPENYTELRSLLEAVEKMYSENAKSVSLQAEFRALRMRARLRSNLTRVTAAFVILAGVSGWVFYSQAGGPIFYVLSLVFMAIFIFLAFGAYAQRRKNWERNDNLIDTVIPHFPTSGLLWRMKSQLTSKQSMKTAFVETGSGKGDRIV